MSALLADTSFFVAYLSRNDEHHGLAYTYMTDPAIRIVTTQWVLSELGNYLAESWQRRVLVKLVRQLYADSRVRIVPADTESFERALALYAARDDKQWSFTDCTSIVTMQRHRITEALTTDHHFSQAGLKILLA